MNKEKIQKLQENPKMISRADSVADLLDTIEAESRDSWAGEQRGGRFRDDLKETPWRVAKMYDELYYGYELDAVQILKEAMFKDIPGDDIVIVKDIPLQSMCAHHMMPFFGVAHVAYIPKAGKVVGLSKIARVVDVYMRRLQSQENIGNQVAQAIIDALDPLGVAVIISAEHTCMTFRGIQAIGTKTNTACLRGVFKMDGKAREELYALLSL